MEWLEVNVIATQEAAEAVSDVLSCYTPHGVALDYGDDATSGAVTLRIYLAVDDEVEHQRQNLSLALANLDQTWIIAPPTYKTIQDQDWTAGWKESIPILHLGQRIVIRPSWKAYTPAPDEVVLVLDPGMAFGTGLHPTTQLCIVALESYIKLGARVLDLGCGTGILALVAAKLGATEVLAVDNDRNAVTVTRRNARENQVAHLVHAVYGSLAGVDEQYDIVLANILAPTIIHMAENGLRERVREEGLVIASGILDTQADDVTIALGKVGLRVLTQIQRETWCALTAKRL